MMNKKPALIKEREGWRYYGAAVTYAIFGYGFGIAGLFNSSPAINFAATLLLAHAMTIAAYLIHECGHNVVFHRHRDNAASFLTSF